jgi:hypothetical protein
MPEERTVWKVLRVSQKEKGSLENKKKRWFYVVENGLKKMGFRG